MYLLARLNDEISDHLVDLLSEEDAAELDTLLESTKDQEEINAFFEKKIPNLSDEIAKAMANFKEAYLY
jgi:hypothetical protein